MLENTLKVRLRTCITCTDRASQTDGVVLPGGIIANEDALKCRTVLHVEMISGDDCMFRTKKNIFLSE